MIFIFFIAEAQTDSTAIISDTTSKIETIKPVFQGDYAQFISQNIKYPRKAIRNRIQGKVIVEYILEKDGSITDAVVLQGIGFGCDEEALRVIKMMSKKWKPGSTLQGEPIRFRTLIPISFFLK